MSTFNFLFYKCIFQYSEHNKFEKKDLPMVGYTALKENLGKFLWRNKTQVSL